MPPDPHLNDKLGITARYGCRLTRMKKYTLFSAQLLGAESDINLIDALLGCM